MSISISSSSDHLSMKILVVNPNSSALVTSSIEKLLSRVATKDTEYFTAPAEAPKEICDLATLNLSTKYCLPELEPRLKDYDGILVACYSNHPLIHALKDLQKTSPRKTAVSGLFNASLAYAVSHLPQKFAILTSNNEWEIILNDSVKLYFGGVDIPYFCGTYASNVNVLGLQNPENFEKIVLKVNQIIEDHPDVQNILLGCAGFSGLEGVLGARFPNLTFIDSVVTGYKLLTVLVPDGN